MDHGDVSPRGLRDESPTSMENGFAFQAGGLKCLSCLLVVCQLDIWRPESAKLPPKMIVAFSIREKREIAGAPVSGSSWSPKFRVLQSLIPFVPGIFCVWPAAERHFLCCKLGSLGDSMELTELPLFTDTACTSGN